MDLHIHSLLDAQGGDGGWGYHAHSTSWTEPTALCLLALRSARSSEAALGRGQEWLARSQRADGGWAPQRCIDKSTWVTSLAAMARSNQAIAAPFNAAKRWLLRETGRSETTLDRLRGWLAGQPIDTPAGWAWYPGTACWVIPTSMSILALRRWPTDEDAKRRIANAQEYLLTRRCADGGWNHGGTQILSENAWSYPETTGIALLSLQGTSSVALEKALERAELMLANCQSKEGTEWLQLGIAAHGHTYLPKAIRATELCTSPLTITALALRVISAQTDNAFLTPPV